jgi:nucleoside-diphosphate-sugar epimerase
MRVAVTGATGNVGVRVVDRLLAAGHDVVGLARRPAREDNRVSWVATDVARADAGAALARAFDGCAAVVHLAWQIQPDREGSRLRATNVDGTRRVLAAVLEARVPTLVYASSVGAYSPGPHKRRVDESWPTGGIASSLYSRHKAEVERFLDGVEAHRPELRVVRLRPGLVFQAGAASEIARYFLGPLLAPGLLPRRPRVLPWPIGAAVQVVHSRDLAEAYVAAVLQEVHGSFNVTAEPPLTARTVARGLGGMPLPVPFALVRAVAAAGYAARLSPTNPGWVDLGRRLPLMDTGRAARELGWAPVHPADEALREVLDGLSERRGGGTPVLRPLSSTRRRLREELPAGRDVT